MDGLPVEYGETISRTGSMVVRSDAPVSVSQDGVDWVPVGLVDGAPQFVLGSAGRMSISVNNREIFFFNVEFQPDFIFSENNLRQLEGSNVLEIIYGRSSYCQSRFLENADNMSFAIRPRSITPAELIALDTHCNQDAVLSSNISSDLVVYRFSNFDSSTYFQFSVGNVLLGFLAPVN